MVSQNCRYFAVINSNVQCVFQGMQSCHWPRYTPESVPECRFAFTQLIAAFARPAKTIEERKPIKVATFYGSIKVILLQVVKNMLFS